MNSFKKIFLAIFLFTFAINAYAFATIIAVAIYAAVAVAVDIAVTTVIATSIAMIASSIISKAFFSPQQPSIDVAGGSPNPGNRVQSPPATDNKLPVVYGSAYVGGILTDLSITQNNQNLYYCFALSEVTSTNTGQTPDSFTFGDIYYGGKRVIFDQDGPRFQTTTCTVTGLFFGGFAPLQRVQFSGTPPSPFRGGDRITFSSDENAIVYTITSGTNPILYPNSFAVTPSAPSSIVSSTIYRYQNLTDAGQNVIGLLDESTGITDYSVRNKIQIYLYSNGSNSPYNSTTSAINVMQSDGLVYKWDSQKLMTNCAFAIIKLTYSQSAGITGIQQTKFQVINSRNSPGDVIYDYLINTRYGASIPSNQIDTTSLEELSVYSDELFTYTAFDGTTSTQKRFEFNGVVDTNRSIMSSLQDMASCCDCLIKYGEIYGEWGVIVQKPDYTVAMNLDDSNVISSITISPLDIAATYNICEVKFPDRTNQDSFNSVTFNLATIDPDLLFPNEPVNKQSITLPFVSNNVTAQYLATRFLESAREDLQVQLSINYVGLQLEAGDIVTLTNVNYGWTNKLFRISRVVQNIGSDASVTASLMLLEYNPQVYDDKNITQFDPSPNTGLGSPSTFGIVPAPVISSLNVTAVNPFIVLQITTPSAGITQYSEIWYSAYSNPLQEQMYFAGTSEIQSNGTPWNINTVLPNINLTEIPSGNWYFFCRAVNNISSSPYSPPSALVQWRPNTIQYSEKYVSIAYANNINGGGFSLNPRGKSYYGIYNTSGSSPSTTPSDYTWYLAEPNFGTTVYFLYSVRTSRRASFDTGFATYAAGTASFVPSQATLFDPSLWAALQDDINIIDLDIRTGQLLESGTTTVGTGEIAINNNPDGKVVASLKPFLDFGVGIPTKTSSAATITVDIYGRVVGFEPPDNFYYTQQIFTATSGQTVFNVTRSSGYISGQCWVLQNGLLLNPTEYTDTSGSTGTVTLTVGATLNDVITIISFKSTNATTGVYASFTRNDVSLSGVSSYTPSSFTLQSGYEILFLNGTVINEQDYDIVGNTISNFPSLLTGNLTIIQWSPNNLGVPNGTPINIVQQTITGQTIYAFSYNINAFNLYQNGVLLRQAVDYTTGTGQFTLTNTPGIISDILVQQTFARTGAV